MFFNKIVILGLVLTALSSCKKFVDVDIADNLIQKEDTFTSDNSATSATLALYSYYPTVNSLQYVTWLGGLAADELQNTTSTTELIQFSQNVVATNNSYPLNYLWNYPYQVIRESNAIIDGVTKSAAITPAVKDQLIGEAKFFRAYMNFNMVNYFGGVPIVTDPLESNSANLPRAAATEVYAHIITDLKDAQNLLPTTYVGTAALRVRANKWAATALLAKVYLYTKDYANAELESTKIIASGTYTMSTLANTFVNTSSETILQLSTLYGASSFSTYRTALQTDNIAPPAYVLYTDFTKGFELNDNRKTSWIDSTTFNAIKYYRINKYKLPTRSALPAGNEFTVLFRLGEQYLIRAEARAQQGNISGAQSDVNVIRTRAGLRNTLAADLTSLSVAIAKERKLELFGETGNRWFDLKRTGTADAVLGALKPTYKTTSQLMPIPVTQILANGNLVQNPGYN